jgi:PAS domain S-box-containing protein
MFEITGYTPNELIQLSSPEIVPKEDLQYLIEQLSKHSKKKVALTKDIPIVRKDKRIVYCDATSKLMKIGNNEFVVGFLRDVTEQKKAEKQIKELAKFPAENPTPVLRISKDNSILYANKPAETFMENLKQTKSQSLPILLKESVQGSLKSGSSVIVENDYTDRIYSFVVTPVIEEDYVNVYGRDITEQKKAEDALMASIEKYRELINGMNDTALVLDFEGKIIDANKTAVEVLGYSKEELLSSTPQLFDATLKPEAIRNLVEQMKTHSLLVFETTHRTKKGKVFPVEISTSRVMYNGKPAILSIARDITERKKADEALRESEEKYRTIINSMNDSAWIIDFDENIIDANEAAIKMLGYSKEELLSMKPRDFDENISDKQAQTLVHKVKAGEKYVFETLHTAKSGKKIPVELSTSFIMYQGKPAVLSIARDITERKKAQLALNATMHLLQQSNQELESYTYVVSHDLKAPLRTLRSFGSFILEDYADKLDETGKDYLNRMINAAAHMDTLIEDLLVLSRVGRKYTEFEQTDLNQVLAEIQSDIEMTIKERHAKIVVDKLPVLLVQRVWIKQLFMNLMNNALKFNESEMPTVKISYQETDVDHLFKVQDNGIGIDEKYHKRIFNLFERAPTEKKYEGTGAGLSICKKIVEQLGGKIWVESTVGKGSTFMFNIPKERKKSGENEHDEQK